MGGGGQSVVNSHRSVVGVSFAEKIEPIDIGIGRALVRPCSSLRVDVRHLQVR